MSKPEWGTKRVCQSCGAKFYDFNKRPIKCPKCGAEFDLEAMNKPKRGRKSEKLAAKPALHDDEVAPLEDEELEHLGTDEADVAEPDETLDGDDDLDVEVTTDDSDR